MQFCPGRCAIAFVLCWSIAITFDFAKADTGPVLELDLDGVLDGPDTSHVAVGDTVRLDAWLTWSSPLWSWSFVLCHSEIGLEYVDASFHPNTEFPSDPDVTPDCVGLAGGSTQYPNPLKAVSVRYVAIGAGSIHIDALHGEWLDGDFQDGGISTIIFARMVVHDPATSVETSTWTRVKGLFR